MTPVVDLSKVKAQEPIPADWYQMIVETAEEGVSKANHPKINVGWKVLEGPYAKRMVFDIISFAPNALPITKQKLIGMGFADDFDGEISAEELIGIQALVRVEIEQETELDSDTGEPYPPRNRVRRIKVGNPLPPF